MFISYFTPLYGSQQNLSATVISSLIMVNSLISAYLSPFVVKVVLKIMDAGKSVILYAAVNFAMLLALSIYQNMTFLLIAVAVLGIADSFGLVMLVEAMMTRPEAKRDAARAMIFITLASKIGQTAAPTLIAADGGTPLMLACVTIVGAALYLLSGAGRIRLRAGALKVRKKQSL
jgi:hypothetical protein